MAYKVKKEHVKFILDELKKNKTITLEEILTKLKTKYKDVDLSLMHVHRIVKDNNITFENNTHTPRTSEAIWERY